MTSKIGRPRIVENGVFVKTLIPADTNAAVDSVVAASGGLSKRGLLRQALLIGLEELGIIPPNTAQSLKPTPSPKGRTK